MEGISMNVVICCSTRFERWLELWKTVLMLAGHRVHISNTPFFQDDHRVKEADEIVVLNPYGYVGSGVMSQIEAALLLNKKIRFLESWGKGFGVGENHHQYLQDSKIAHGLPADYVSPVDVPSFGMSEVTYSDLLGPPGEKRSSLIELVSVGEYALKRYGSSDKSYRS